MSIENPTCQIQSQDVLPYMHLISSGTSVQIFHLQHIDMSFCNHPSTKETLSLKVCLVSFVICIHLRP